MLNKTLKYFYCQIYIYLIKLLLLKYVYGEVNIYRKIVHIFR